MKTVLAIGGLFVLVALIALATWKLAPDPRIKPVTTTTVPAAMLDEQQATKAVDEMQQLVSRMKELMEKRKTASAEQQKAISMEIKQVNDELLKLTNRYEGVPEATTAPTATMPAEQP